MCHLAWLGKLIGRAGAGGANKSSLAHLHAVEVSELASWQLRAKLVWPS